MIRPLLLLCNPRLATLAIVFIALSFTTNTFAQDDGLQGCWKITQITRPLYKKDPIKFERECFRLIENDRITSGCNDRKSRGINFYRLTGSGVIETTTSKAPKTYSPKEYKLNGNQLIFSLYRQSPVKEIYRIVEMKRIQLSSDQTCLPALVTVSKEEFSRYYMIPQLVASYTGSRLSPFMGMGLEQNRLFNIPIKTARSEDIRRFLIEFDKITGELSSIIQKRLKSNPQSFAEAYFAANKYDPASDVKLATVEKQQWANDTAREILGVSKFPTHFAVLSTMFRDSLQEVAREELQGKGLFDRDYGIGGSYRIARELVQSRFFELLPEGIYPMSRQSLINLRQLSVRNSDLATSRRYSPLELEQGVGKAAAYFLKQDKEALAGIGKQIKNKLDLLAFRFRKTLDPKVLGYCAVLKKIDKTSAAASDGDWRKVTKPDGQPILSGSREHFQLLRFYRNGCAKPKDFFVIRKILEDIAESPWSKKSWGRSSGRYCKLARWTRYGVGGERSEDKALEWEKRFRAEAYRVSINPTDEEMKKLRTKYPQRAHKDYLCRPSSAKSLIDPRDPWKDLK